MAVDNTEVVRKQGIYKNAKRRRAKDMIGKLEKKGATSKEATKTTSLGHANDKEKKRRE